MTNNMVTNRTRADVNAVTTDSATPQKGSYNYTDLNRVELKVRELNNILISENYMTALTTKLDWSYTDIFTQADATRYLNNIKALRNALAVKSTTPKVPSTMNKMTYTTANNIEKILVDIEDIVNGLRNWFVYSGVASSGQPRLWQHRFHDLPYEQLNYIESTGTQYIDTGFYANNNTRVEFSCVPMTITDGEDWQCLFSSKTSYHDNEFVIQVKKENSSWYSAFGNVSEDGIVSASSDFNYTIDKNKNITTINGTSTTLTNNTFTATQTGWIFADNESGALHYFLGRLFYLKIYNDGTLVRDFIPARRKSDGAICLYNLLDNTFYTNQGTGTFLYG